MQEKYLTLTNPRNNEKVQLIIRSTSGRNAHCRIQYGLLLVSIPPRLFKSPRLLKDFNEKFLPDFLEKNSFDFYSPLLINDIGPSYIHILGDYLPLDFCFHRDRQMAEAKKITVKNFKKALAPLIEKSLSGFHIYGITYKVMVVSSITYIGQLSRKISSRESNKQFSYIPSEVVGRNYIFRFSWYLGFFSLPIINAIVVHETAHILEQHHVKAFYNYIYLQCPDYDYLTRCLTRGFVRGEKEELI